MFKIERNKPCFCNSGKKYKYCCLGKDNKTRISGEKRNRVETIRLRVIKELDIIKCSGCDLLFDPNKEYQVPEKFMDYDNDLGKYSGVGAIPYKTIWSLYANRKDFEGYELFRIHCPKCDNVLYEIKSSDNDKKKYF